MGAPSLLVAVVWVLTITLPAASVCAQGSSLGQHSTNSNTTGEGQGNQCSLCRRQDLLDTRLIQVNKQMTERDTRLNGLVMRQNEDDARLNGVDARLNRIDSRFDALETMMSDMKEYLRQRIDAIEVKAELALNKQTTEVTPPDNQPTPTTTPRLPKDCQEAYTMGSTSSGVYTIAPEPNTHIRVLCEQELDGGGWIVFQLRKDGTVDFDRDWNAYKQGFGELTGEFWLGNTNIHLLSKHHDQQLMVELTSQEGEVKYANYAQFWTADVTDKFRLRLSLYSGGTPPGDSMSYVNGAAFSTKDQDNDVDPASLAVKCMSGGWFTDNAFSNLNGQYGGTDVKGIWWWYWKRHVSMRGTRMMMRKRP